MTRQLRRVAALSVVLACCAAPAWAKAKPTCEDRCKDDLKACVDVCTTKAGAKMLSQCKSMCKEGEKYCYEQCKKKGH